MKRTAVLSALLLLCGLLLGCSMAHLTRPEGEDALRAVYVPYDAQGRVLTQAGAAQGFVLRGFAGEEDFFTATLPEALYGPDGEKITPEALSPGAVLDLYGDGIMLETYPGRYPGVTRVQVVEAGDPADALACQPFIDRFYAPPDPSQVPSLNVECRTELAVSSTVAASGSYKWSWPNEDGTQGNAIACGPHVLQWPNLPQINAGQERDLTLWFSRTPSVVTARRWPSEALGSEDPAGDETAPVTFSDGVCTLSGALPGYVYQINAIWDEGNVEYGFLVR